MATGSGCSSSGKGFGFANWSDGEFRYRFIDIIGGSGRRNNTYKLAMARFLLDHSCDPCAMQWVYGRPRGEAAAAPGTANVAGAGNKVTYAEMARYFFAYYWPLACEARLRQGPARQKPLVIQAIEGEFGEGECRLPVRRIICEQPAKVERCLKEVARVAPRQVVVRFQKVDGAEDPMFYQFAAGQADREGNRRIDPRGGILVNGRAARFFRENYGALNRAVAFEWLKATDAFNPGVPDLVAKFCKIYDAYGGACRFLPCLEAAGRVCFYCGARPGLDERMCIDHVLPADYVGGTEPWNLVLACQRCGRGKACMLPPPEYVDKLSRRNAGRRGAGGAPPDSAPSRPERGVEWHYKNAKSLVVCVL